MGLIQLCDVPDDVHRTLKGRAAAEGTSLSHYVLREMIRVARTPTPAELDTRIRSRGAAGVSTEDILAARDAGDARRASRARRGPPRRPLHGLTGARLSGPG